MCHNGGSSLELRCGSAGNSAEASKMHIFVKWEVRLLWFLSFFLGSHHRWTTRSPLLPFRGTYVPEQVQSFSTGPLDHENARVLGCWMLLLVPPLGCISFLLQSFWILENDSYLAGLEPFWLLWQTLFSSVWWKEETHCLYPIIPGDSGSSSSNFHLLHYKKWETLSLWTSHSLQTDFPPPTIIMMMKHCEVELWASDFLFKKR
jgi:hypothetical protein